jgi:hypothetical protein
MDPAYGAITRIDEAVVLTSSETITGLYDRLEPFEFVVIAVAG